MRQESFLALLLFAPSAAVAQAVWNVPSTADVNTFIALAAPGDILMLADNHPTFVLNKGLVILGLGPVLTPTTGTTIGGLGPIYVNVPAGQRASLVGFSLFAYSQTVPTPGLQIQSGDVYVADVHSATGVRVDGSAILERVQVASGGLLVATGRCEVTDSLLVGRDASTTGFGFTPSTPGIWLTSATARLVASHVTAIGGAGVGFAPPSSPGAPGLSVTAGTAYVTEASFTGGAAGPTTPGGVAVLGNGSVELARTALTEGVGAITVSSGYQQVPEMVGMHCSAPPTRGTLFQVVATAGSSQDLLGIVGGLDRTSNTVAPIVEPLFGIPTQLIALTLAFPAPGAPVAASVPVPNVATLFGAEVWLQAVQLAGSTIRASTVVGGTIR